ncbi:MAG: PQQ-binding-like beta-propeller repeat protein [Planctomycetota bacterium]|jgi:outer membrane protein assembly factor BamB
MKNNTPVRLVCRLPVPGGVGKVGCLVVMALAGLTEVTPAFASDWPNFRGPHHDGISPETGLRNAGEESLQLLWERELGSAFSSFAVVKDRIYTCGTVDKQQVLFCLDVGDGKVIWQKAIDKAYNNEHGNGTRATPTIADGRVYILSAHGRLHCLDAGTGKQVWLREFHNPPTWGYSASVLIEGNLAISTAGAQEGALAAFDRLSGEPVWQCGNDPVGYATPYPFTFEGKRYVVGFTGKSAVIAEMATGKMVLQLPWDTAWLVNAAAPIFDDGYLLLSSGYRTGAGVFQLGSTASGLTAKKVWSGRALLNKFQSCILKDGYLYTSDQRGLKCVEFMTGREAWSIPRLKHGTLVLAEDHLYLLTEGGQLRVGPASPLGFEPQLTADILSGRCWTVSVIHNQRLIARSLERVVCFDLKKPQK